MLTITFDFENYLYSAIIAIVAGILGVAYPLCIGAIQRLKDEYKTDKAIDWFENEDDFKDVKFFLAFSLGLAAVMPFLWYCFEHHWTPASGNESIVDWSMALIIFQCVLAGYLVFFFFRMVSLIITYSSTMKLARRTSGEELEKLTIILRCADSNRNDDAYMLALPKVMEAYAKKITEIHERDAELPIALDGQYLSCMRLLLEPAALPAEYPHLSKDVTVIRLLYDGAVLKLKISNSTYRLVWYWLNKACEAHNAVWLQQYWDTALEYISFSKWTLGNAERAKFIEYHYFVCALLLASDNQSALFHALTVRNAAPDCSPLLPSTFMQVVDAIMSVLHSHNPFYLTSNYSMYTEPFDAQSEERLKSRFIDFMALAVLWLPFNRSPYGGEPEAFTVPGDWSKWDIETLRADLEVILGRIKENFDSYKPYFRYGENPKRYLDHAKQTISAAIDKCINEIRDIEFNETIDPERMNEVKADIYGAFQHMRWPIEQCSTNVGDETETLPLRCETYVPAEMVMRRQHVSVANFAESIVESIRAQIVVRLLSLLLGWSPRKTYLVQYDSLRKAIDRLKINGDYIIYDVGCNLFRYMENGVKPFVDDGGNFQYNGAKIVEIPYTRLNFLLVLKRFNQPKYELEDLSLAPTDDREPIAEGAKLYFKEPKPSNNMTLGIYAQLKLSYPKWIKMVRINISTDRAIGKIDLDSIRPFDEII